jgi:hypothetical protein
MARLAELGGTPLTMTPAEISRLVVTETEKWVRVVKAGGAKPDRSADQEKMRSTFLQGGLV